jgi:hypothetical protein
MSTALGWIFWIFWAIGVIDIYLGLYFVWANVWAKKYRSNHRKILIGWLLMIIGLMFNSVAALIEFKWLAFALSIVGILLDYHVYKTKKKEFGIKENNMRKLFLNEIAEYKYKLDRKRFKII